MDINSIIPAVLKAPEAVKPFAETGCKLIESLLGKPFKELGGLFGDFVEEWRWKNRVKIAHRTQELLNSDGVAARLVPPSFLIPLLESCGDVDDPDLQELWARLLASSVENKSHQRPAFIHVLKQLTPEDAQLLRWMRERAEEWNNSEPPGAPFNGECTSVEARDYFKVSHSRIVSTAHSLIRLGIIEEPDIRQNIRPADRNTPEMTYMLTVFGSDFADACMKFSTPPEEYEPAQERRWK